MASKRKELIHKNIVPLGIGILCILVSFLLSRLQFMSNFENFLIDARFKYKTHLTTDSLVTEDAVQRGTAIKVGKKVQSPIMVFGIDEKSINELGRWPWPRSVHKEFLDFFFNGPNYENKPYIVFYDLFFDQFSSLLLKPQNVNAIKSFIEKYVNQRSMGTLQTEIHIRQNQLKKLNSDELIGDIREMISKTIDDPIFFNKLKEIRENVANNTNEATRGGYIVTDFLASGQVLGRFAPEIVAGRLKYLQNSILTNIDNPQSFRHILHRDLKPPVLPVLKNTAGNGAAMIFLDSDGVVRRMPMLYRFYDERPYVGADGKTRKVMDKPVFLATIDLIIAMNYYNVPAERVKVIFGKHIKLLNARVPIFKQEFERIQGFAPIPKGWAVERYETRDIVIPIDNAGQMMINFQGQHQSFENQPYFEGVNMQRQRNFDNRVNYKNKVILVGFYSSAGLGEGRDYFTTPYKILYGIEIHANALQTIFEQRFVTQIGTTANLAIYGFMLILFIILLPRVKIWVGFLIFIGSLIVIFLGGMIVFSSCLILFNMVSLMAFALILFLAITVYRLLTEEKEKRQIKGMFAQYVNPEVVTELMLDPDKLQLGGQDSELTVMFSDIRGFTTISESLKPQELVTLLNAYLSQMTDILFEYRGTLDKYIGDAVMAFWGAPVPLKNHAILAADACLKMMEKVHELNANLKNDPQYSVFKEKNLSIDIGIGLNSGVMTVGNMGSEVRKNYTIMGDNVNLGSRLEGVNKVYSTNIIISESTYELVKNHFICRELDYIRVKGKKLPVKIYELLDRKEGVTSDIIRKLD